MPNPIDTNNIRNRIHYLQPMIDSDHRNSMWYGGDVLTIEHKGVTVSLTANGDIAAAYVPGKTDTGRVSVSDRNNKGLFATVMTDVVPNDESLLHLMGADPDAGQDSLDVTANNWWEAFVHWPGQEPEATVLDSTNYDEAVTELLDRIDDLVARKPSGPSVYVYHEYHDDLPYGEQIIKVFADETAGMAYLRQRAEAVLRMPWPEIESTAGKDDTVSPRYVSIDDGARCRFFALDGLPVETACPKEDSDG